MVEVWEDPVREDPVVVREDPVVREVREDPVVEVLENPTTGYLRLHCEQPRAVLPTGERRSVRDASAISPGGVFNRGGGGGLVIDGRGVSEWGGEGDFSPNRL